MTFEDLTEMANYGALSIPLVLLAVILGVAFGVFRDEVPAEEADDLDHLTVRDGEIL